MGDNGTHGDGGAPPDSGSPAQQERREIEEDTGCGICRWKSGLKVDADTTAPESPSSEGGKVVEGPPSEKCGETSC
jgi:hypothetical protein